MKNFSSAKGIVAFNFEKLFELVQPDRAITMPVQPLQNGFFSTTVSQNENKVSSRSSKYLIVFALETLYIK